MIWQPKIGQWVKINYKDKSMPCQGLEGEVVAVGRHIKNALVQFKLLRSWPHSEETFFEGMDEGVRRSTSF